MATMGGDDTDDMTGDEWTRTVSDAAGVVWHVREVKPGPLSMAQRRVLARPEYEHGWLLFQSETGEKRRFAPYPPDWTSRPDREVRDWCAAARSATHSRPGGSGTG
jgi:hypothetical protein